MKKTYRFNRALSYVSGVFGSVGLTGIVLSPWLSPDLRFAAISIGVIYLLIAGLAIAMWGARVELSDDRIAVYKRTGAAPAELRWSEIESYEYRKGEHYPGTGTWQLKTRDLTCDVPRLLEDYADLQRQILSRLPSEKVKAPREHRLRNSDSPTLEVSQYSAVSLFNGAVGFLFMLIAPIAWLFQPRDERWLVLGILMFIPLFLIVLAGIPSVWEAVRSLSSGKLMMDATGATYKTRSIPWRDLLMFESRLMTRGRGGPTYALYFVGRDHAFTLDNADASVARIEAFAASHAPAEAILILAKLPEEQS